MSLTGEPEGAPMKVGVSIADMMAGMYAGMSILAAVRHQQITGEGQHIDIAMLDTHVAWLANQGMNYFGDRRDSTAARQYAPEYRALSGDALFRRLLRAVRRERSGLRAILRDGGLPGIVGRRMLQTPRSNGSATAST